MNKFVFRYSPIAWVTLIIIAAIFGLSTAANVYDAIKFADENTVQAVVKSVVAAASFAAFICAVAAAVYGRYVIKGKYLYCRFGFFYTKTDINKIFQITEFKAQNKLVMYFTDEKYSVAVISEKNYDKFYAALKAVNPAITYTVQHTDEK